MAIKLNLSDTFGSKKYRFYAGKDGNDKKKSAVFLVTEDHIKIDQPISWSRSIPTGKLDNFHPDAHTLKIVGGETIKDAVKNMEDYVSRLGMLNI